MPTGTDGNRLRAVKECDSDKEKPSHDQHRL